MRRRRGKHLPAPQPIEWRVIKWIVLVAIPWILAILFMAPLWRHLFSTKDMAPSNQAPMPAGQFYGSKLWRRKRIAAFERNIKTYGKKTCELCRRTKLRSGDHWHVHHKKSRSWWPTMRLDEDNLAVLCGDCNMGMSNDFQDLDLTRCSRKQAARRRQSA